MLNKTSKKNILYIHPYCNKDNSDFVFLPGGIIGVINNLRKKGFKVIGVNLPLEMKLNRNIDIKETLKEIDFQIVIMDCHWYYFLYGVQEVARVCKEINPKCYVIIGGFSANFFRKNILTSSDNIDVIIKGDSETLLPKICNDIISEGKKSIKKFPNVSYENVFWFMADKEIKSFDNDINKFDYVDMTFMKHWQEYLKFHPGKEAPGISQIVGNKQFFYLPTQKGCKNLCPACGGSKFSYKILSNKKELCVRSPEKIINDIKKLKDMGVKNVMVSCESNLNNWPKILKELERENIFIDILFEDWQLPNKKLTKQMVSYAKNTDSGFLVSALSGNDIIRIKNGKHYKNKELSEFAKSISKSCSSYATFWFSPNLVGGTQKYFQDTILLAKELTELNKFAEKPNINVLMSPMEVDITSDVYSNPSSYKFSGKLWGYDYIIKLLRFREQGKKLGNMSYCSKEINIEEGNKMCEKFKEEISLLKNRIRDFRKSGIFPTTKTLIE